MNVFHYTTLATDTSKRARTLHYFALADTDSVIMIEYDANGGLTVVSEKTRLNIMANIVPETLALDYLDAETLLAGFAGAHTAARAVAEQITLSNAVTVP